MTHVEGLPELLKKFRKLPAEFREKNAKNPINKALMAAALPIVKRAQELNPDDTLSTEKAIRRRRVKNPREMHEVEIFVDTRSRKAQRRPWYWFFIEFGTSKKAARPFMRPAFETEKNNTVERFRVRFAKSIELIVKKLR